jgi:hypothetical protein
VVLHADSAERERGHNELDQGARGQVLQGLALPRLQRQECVPGAGAAGVHEPVGEEGHGQPGQALRGAGHRAQRRGPRRPEQQRSVQGPRHRRQQLQPDRQLLWRAAQG